MNLFKNEWNEGKDSFDKFLKNIEIQDGKDINSSDYVKTFSIDAFPLRIGMEKINKVEGLNVEIHPGYSKNEHIYIVKFIGKVELKSGAVGDISDYKYSYTIRMENQIIQKMSLNEVYKVVKPAEDKEK